MQTEQIVKVTPGKRLDTSKKQNREEYFFLTLDTKGLAQRASAIAYNYEMVKALNELGFDCLYNA